MIYIFEHWPNKQSNWVFIKFLNGRIHRKDQIACVIVAGVVVVATAAAAIIIESHFGSGIYGLMAQVIMLFKVILTVEMTGIIGEWPL